MTGAGGQIAFNLIIRRAAAAAGWFPAWGEVQSPSLTVSMKFRGTQCSEKASILD